MKGIREAAMSQEEEETPSTAWPKAKNPSLFDKGFDYDRYDGSWNNPEAYSSRTYKPKENTDDDIKITLTIPYSKIGSFADVDSPNWNDVKAETKAIEIAYDRIEALLGKGYESKFSVNFDASDDYDAYEVEVTLSTPTK
jgi:hypothetical protein